jgi:hypothetical protein
MTQTNWKKLGKVFDPTKLDSGIWMREYAQYPTPFILNDNVLRVYFATRPSKDSDLMYASYPAYVDLNRHNLLEVINIAKQPLLPLGGTGSFDEFGIIPGSILRASNLVYMYYAGWTLMSSVPHIVNIGLAISRDGGTKFEKVAEGPVLGLTFKEPYFANSPTVKIIDFVWHMWYQTGLKWLPNDGQPESVYQIAHATSLDGIKWERNGKLIVPAMARCVRLPHASWIRSRPSQHFARPCLVERHADLAARRRQDWLLPRRLGLGLRNAVLIAAVRARWPLPADLLRQPVRSRRLRHRRVAKLRPESAKTLDTIH